MSDQTYYEVAFNQGRQAKEDGWERHSPYVRCVAEQYWYAGYDGLEYKKFKQDRRESMKEIKSQLGYSRIGLRNV